MSLTGEFNLKQGEAGFRTHRADVSSKTFSSEQNPFYIDMSVPPVDAQAQSTTNPLIADEDGQVNTVADLAEKSEHQGNLMEVMYPDRDYKAEATDIDPNKYMRDPDKPVENIDSMTSAVSNLKTDLNEKHAQFTQDFQQARSEAVDALKNSAARMGYDAGIAEDTMVAKPQAVGAGTMVAGAGSLVTGVGPVAGAAAGAGAAYLELGKDQKKLTPDQQKAVMEDMLKSLQSSRQSPEARQEAGAKEVMSGDDLKSNTKSDVAWENMTVEDLAHLINSPPDGSNQDLFEEHELGAEKLAMIDGNWAEVRREYASTVTDDKMYSLERAGNEGMTNVLRDAEEVQCDAAHMSLTSDFLASVGGKVSASDVAMDTNEVATALNHDKIDYEAAGRQLDSHISGLNA